MLSERGSRPPGSAHELAAAVGADTELVRAILAERTFECANAGVLGLRRQVSITAFAVGPELKHAGCPR